MTQRLTQLAHDYLLPCLELDGVAVDGTAGNGYDTVFLARMIMPDQHVYAFDIQPQAIKATTQRLEKEDISHRVTLVNAGHEHIDEHLPADVKIAAATFNLGYLPNADKLITTRASTSTIAIEACLHRLLVGGGLTTLAYRGHPGGQDEADAIAAMMAKRDPQVFSITHKKAPANGPVLWFVQRIKR